MMDEQRNCCWLSEEEGIISFHREDNFSLQEFPTKGDLMDFVMRCVEEYSCRIQ